MKASIATFTILGITNYSQSRFHEEPKLKGELADKHDKRTWLSRSHLDAEDRVVIPTGGFVQCLQAGAKYSKKKIDGGRGATWTAKFLSGLMMNDDPITDQTKGDLLHEDVYCNSDGVRGSGKRVMRRYPYILAGWRAPAEIWIVDPIITQDVFVEIAEISGMFIGLGRWRPEKGGQNGRFKLTDLKWEDNRDFESAIARKFAGK